MLAGCSVFFDYGEDPQGSSKGGAASSTSSLGGATSVGGGGGSGGEGGSPPQACGQASDCPSSADDGDCQTTTCEENLCVVSRLVAGTPVGSNNAGDCRVNACNDQGQPEIIDDDGDVPVDGLECTLDQCNAGVPSNPPAGQGSPCGMNGALVCNDTGDCVGCNNDTQCLPDSACQDHFCDTATTVCDVMIASNGTACTSDGMFCSGVEACQNGSCVSPGDPCTGADGDGDCSETCDENNDDCQGNDLNGSACNDSVYCNGSDTCQAGNCDQHSGDPCPGPDADGDCSESCNEGADNCSANDQNGTTCQDDGMFCTGSESCQAGLCVGSGNPCQGADGDGDCGESCDEGANNCSGNDPNGSTCNDNVFCNGGDSCMNGSCSVHAGDPCDGTDGDGDCSEQCDEGADNCNGNDPNATMCDDNVYCNGSDTCNNGTCSLHTGDPCQGVDNDLDCTESCNEGADNCTANDPVGSPCANSSGCCLGGFCESEPGVCPF